MHDDVKEGFLELDFVKDEIVPPVRELLLDLCLKDGAMVACLRELELRVDGVKGIPYDEEHFLDFELWHVGELDQREVCLRCPDHVSHTRVKLTKQSIVHHVDGWIVTARVDRSHLLQVATEEGISTALVGLKGAMFASNVRAIEELAHLT